MKKKRCARAISLLLTLLLCGCATPLFANAAGYSGVCGDSVTWALDAQTGVLTVGGEGAMTDYVRERQAPWTFCLTMIRSVVVADGVTHVGSYAFALCPFLSDVTLPDSVTDVGQSAFYNCARLSRIELHANLRHIGTFAFSGTALYTDAANWSDDALYIGRSLISTNRALSGAYRVQEDTVCVADGALQDCGDLTSLEIPASVCGIGDKVFTGCFALERIDVDADNAFYCSDASGVLFSKEKTLLLCCPADCIAARYVIPDGVEEIADRAFYCCGKLREVCIPDSVTRIGEAAFYGCRLLTFVRIPSGVTVIEKHAFADCRLKALTLGNTVTEVGDYAFGWNSLENVTFAPSVRKIGYDAFIGNTLKSVCFGGTVDDWLASDIDDSNSTLLQAPRYYHTHDDGMPTEVRGAVAATCDTDGFSGDTVYLPCGALKEAGSTVPATGHDWDVGTVTIEPTCDRSGEITYSCKNDPVHIYTESISATGHLWDNGAVTREPTCTEDGVFTYTCRNDDAHTRIECIPARGHDYGTVQTAPTCEQSGGISVVCSRCGRHDAQAERVIMPLGHIWDEGVVAREPTCTQDGIVTFACTRDDTHTRTESISAKGHVFGMWRQTKAPTVKEEGEAQRTCAVCGETETILLDKLPVPDKMTLSKAAVTLTYKDSETLTASEEAVWSSSDESVVKVDKSGKLTTVGKGTAVVTARSVRGDKTAICVVTVKYAWWQWLLRIFLLGFLWY